MRMWWDGTRQPNDDQDKDQKTIGSVMKLCHDLLVHRSEKTRRRKCRSKQGKKYRLIRSKINVFSITWRARYIDIARRIQFEQGNLDTTSGAIAILHDQIYVLINPKTAKSKRKDLLKKTTERKSHDKHILFVYVILLQLLVLIVDNLFPHVILTID